VRSVNLPSSPPVQLLGDTAAIRGAAAIDAHRLILRGVRATEREDGIAPSPRLLELVAVLKVAADLARPMSEAGHADVREEVKRAKSSVGKRVEVGEAAQMLGVGPRHTRRLATSIGGRKSQSGIWSFEVAAIESYIADRNERHTT
jgi:hypothetical protein